VPYTTIGTVLKPRPMNACKKSSDALIATAAVSVGACRMNARDSSLITARTWIILREPDFHRYDIRPYQRLSLQVLRVFTKPHVFKHPDFSLASSLKDTASNSSWNTSVLVLS
jgi:hypothetical protein